MKDSGPRQQLQEPIKIQILSELQELVSKGQSKCLEYLLIQDSTSAANKTETLLELDLFNENWLRNGPLHVNSTCNGCCKSNDQQKISEHLNYPMNINGNRSESQTIDNKLNYFDAELNMMKLQFDQFGSFEIMSSQIDFLDTHQQEIMSRMQFYEEAISQMQSTHKLNEISLNDMTVKLSDDVKGLETHLMVFEASMQLIERRLTAIESDFALQQDSYRQPTQYHFPPTQNSDLNVFIYCLELARRLKEKRLNEYFHSDKNMIYFIYITCVQHNSG